ncbi:MAG TPA: hypothetical protein VLI54_02690 [Bacillota bacterium]|nr:hypothetical protein [Bacillota bacterium]
MPPFPQPPELAGVTYPERVVDAHVPEVGQLMTMAERTADMARVQQELVNLSNAHRLNTLHRNDTGPGSSIDTAAGWLGRDNAPVGGRIDPGLAAFQAMAQQGMEKSRTQAGLAVQARVDTAKNNVRNIISAGNPDDFLDTGTDARAAATERERGLNRRAIETAACAQRLRVIEDTRTVRLHDRIQADGAHPTADAAERRVRTARVNRLALEVAEIALGDRVEAQLPRALQDEGLVRGREAFDADAEYYRALQAATAGLTGEVADTFRGLLDGHRRDVRTARHLNDLVVERLSTWRLGEVPDYRQQPGHITNLQELEAATFDRLSLRSTARHELLTGATKERFRTAERLALCPDQSINPGHNFTPDGGLLVDGGAVTIYDDGSRTVYDPALRRDVRRHADGTAWTGPAGADLPQPEWYTNGSAAHRSDAEHQARVIAYRDNWEEIRGANSENDSLHADLEWTDRCEMRIVEREAAITANEAEGNALLGVVGRPGRIEQLENEINRVVAAVRATRKYPAGVAPEDFAVADRTPYLALLEQLNTARDRLQDLEYAHRQLTGEVMTFRTAQNTTEYWVARHTVNSGEQIEIGGVTMPRAQMDTTHPAFRNSVVCRQTRLNGITGDWRIYPDGSADHLNTGRHYLPNGQ